MDAQFGSHRHGAHGWWLVVAAAFIIVLLLAVAASPAAGASRKACHVRNTAMGKGFATLQAAVDAARPGARLTVRGTCVGATRIDRDLVIEGTESSTMGKPRLSALRKSHVMMVAKGARVKLLSLQVVRGDGAGCLRIRGYLVLRDVVVRHCGPVTGCCGVGGAYNYGKLTLNGTSLITRSGPAGVFNRGTLILNGHSSISGNGTEYDAAGVVNLGTLVMNGSSSISRNNGQYTGGVSNYGAMTMNDSSSIEGNFADGEYGRSSAGVYNAVIGPGSYGLRRVHRGVLTMNDTSSIRGNESWSGGGGGLRNSGGEVTMNDASSISGNTAYYIGGGVEFSKGRFTMNDTSSISGNTTHRSGGGVYLGAGRFFMNDTSTISGNVAPEVGEWTNYDGDVVSGGGGGGLFLGGGALHGVTCGPGGKVTGNSPDDCHVEP